MSRILLIFAPDSFKAAALDAYRGQTETRIRAIDDQIDLSDVETAAEWLAASEPDLIAIGPLLSHDNQLALAAALDRTHPEVSVVLVTAATATLWQKALRVGARDIVDPDADGRTIVSSFDRAVEAAGNRKRVLQTKLDVAPVPRGRIITVVSPKGGSGKTVLATNTAVTLARQQPGQVVLVDLDVQFGDIATSLRLTPNYTLYHATTVEAPDSTALKAFLTPHPSSQLLVLCAPDQPEDADDIKPQSTQRMLQQLAMLFPFVVVDTGAGLDDLTLAAAEVSTDVVLVSSTDVPSVTGLRKELHIFDRLGIEARRHFILNRSDARVGLSPADISQSLGLAIAASIPSARAIPVSVNQGLPVVDAEPKSPAAKCLSTFALGLLGRAQASGSSDGSLPSGAPAKTRRFGK